MTIVYALAVLFGLAIMGFGYFSMRERHGHEHRVDETALLKWLADHGFAAGEPDRIGSGKRARRSYRGVAQGDKPAWVSDCGDTCRLRVDIAGPPRSIDIEVRAKWEGHEDAGEGLTTVTFPVPPYIQVWGRATARDANFLGRMLSPAALRRLADAGEGIHVEYHPDGLIIGERHPLTAECATRVVELAQDVVKLWAPVVRELTEAEERRSRPV